MSKRNKSRILTKLSIIAIIIGSVTFPGCEDLRDKLCPCPDPDFPWYSRDNRYKKSYCYDSMSTCEGETLTECYTCP